MYRLHIRFYIDRNDKLRAIWYKERKYRMLQTEGYPRAGDFTHDMTGEPGFAVRSVTIRRSCDKMGINKVRYCYTEEEAKATIDARLLRNKPACPDTITWNHILQLARAPMKYIDYFLDYIEMFYGEGQRDRMSECIIKVAAHDKELRKLWTEQSRKKPNGYGDMV